MNFLRKAAKFGPDILWRILSVVAIFLLILSVAGSAVMTEWSGYINKTLGIQDTVIVETGDGEQDPVHFKSEFETYQETMDNARAVAKQAQAEGTVLMTNENGALPLEKGANVTFFSYSSIDVALGGTGSGGVTAPADRKFDIPRACEEDGKLNYNETMYAFYEGKFDEGYMVTPESANPWTGELVPATMTRKDGSTFVVPEVPASDFTTEVRESWNEYGDAAIFVLTRIGGEGADLITTSSAGEEEGRYLTLSEEERSVLQAMKDGPFEKRIVLVNTFNTPELGFLDEYDIDACLYIGGPGEVGLDAVTDILVGETNPSGRLADTYAYHSFSSPAMANFGDFTYANADEIANATSRKYLMYNEGIYVGYRYYETRYEDTVLGRGNAVSDAGVWASSGDWNYTEEVQFPFGYGLSYATFEQTLNGVDVDWRAQTATVNVTVTNTSGMAGKEVVQVYAQAPYIEGGVEKSAVQLCGFAKTGELAEGQSEEVEIVVDLADIASYDYENYKTYIMDEGDYYFAIGSSAHDALNNILAAKGCDTSDGMDYDGDADKAVLSVKNEFNEAEYSLSATTKKVTNQFQEADINYYLGGTSDEVVYLSRSDWSGTWPETMSDFAATSDMIADMDALYDGVNQGAANKPAAYEKGSSDISGINVSATTLETQGQYSIAMMIGQAYDDAAWEALLSQLSIDDLAKFTKQGREAIPSVGLNASTAVDGPAAWTKSRYKEDYDDFSAEAAYTDEVMVAYPTETVFAGTWNTDLLYEIGVSFGEEGLWGGGVGWYGPAANTHRTPYAGRNFEYYSEDGFIAGKLGEAEVHGAMSKGTIPYFKHFFLNDQETNRIGVCTFSNEQAIREIYLRAFQYAFETTGEGDPSCSGVMGGFNRLGVTWTGHYTKLWKEVMDGEWGFTGNVTTDFGQNPTGLMEPQLAYEAGTNMFCTSGNTFYSLVVEQAKTDAKLLTNMRESAHRILYNFANSAAMNGLTSTTRVVPIMTWYEIALLTMTIASAVVLVAAGAMTLVHTFAKKEEN